MIAVRGASVLSARIVTRSVCPTGRTWTGGALPIFFLTSSSHRLGLDDLDLRLDRSGGVDVRLRLGAEDRLAVA